MNVHYTLCVCVQSLHDDAPVSVCVCVHIHSAQWLSTESQSRPRLNESSVLRREGAGSVSLYQDGCTQT